MTMPVVLPCSVPATLRQDDYNQTCANLETWRFCCELHGSPVPSSSRMDAWPQRRGLQTMNLRSVFTAEQQRILERYYENGMTNQSKACFQLILQCAQEAKLDSTWVGNKRRKLASKVDQNGGVSHSLSSHGLTGGLLSNHTLAGGALSNHSLAAGALLPAEIAAARNIQNRVHLLPPSSSFPSFSSASSSPSSSSPLSSGSNNNNNDVILTGIYSLNSSLVLDQDPQHPHLNQKSSIPHICLRAFSLHCSQEGNFIPWRGRGSASAQTSLNPQPQPSAPQRTRVSIPVQNSSPSSEQTPRIQQVFTLSEKGQGDRLKPGPPSTQKGQEGHRHAPHPLDTSHNFSIAMETGDEADEWLREEELANMAAQTHIHREQTSASPTGADMSVVKGSHTPPMTSSRPTLLHSNTTLQGSYSSQHRPQLQGNPVTDFSQCVCCPWFISNSRKRTLQDRTQFSDGDLIQLKRYWDRGMTSLGSVCREKITAAANQLNVDTEIVKTWISNRRRKYRLMGIEIPPPKGGLLYLQPHPRKVEVIGEDEEEDDDDDDGELVASDLEQMQNLLEFKHEEVQFLENELENQKQKYLELATFTKSLLSAVRNNDLKRQQELMASLPQPSDQDWDANVERGSQTAAESADTSSDHDDSPPAGASSVEPPPLCQKKKSRWSPLTKTVRQLKL
ncbi:hypothetical protein INR49_028421 [Caranx melampygus]|nr:hypothetical protein INR49_028421 [Caranx melampygus]